MSYLRLKHNEHANIGYTLTTFQFKGQPNEYQFSYQYKEFKKLSLAVMSAKKWIKENYPTAKNVKVQEIARGPYGYTMVIAFEYQNLNPDVYTLSYGKIFARHITITYHRPHNPNLLGVKE